VRIATYNVNGINGRLANLLQWLQETTPDIACLQELKASDEKFPAAAIPGTAGKLGLLYQVFSPRPMT
jgi:exodeoxyribonuclease-3